MIIITLIRAHNDSFVLIITCIWAHNLIYIYFTFILLFNDAQHLGYLRPVQYVTNWSNGKSII